MPIWKVLVERVSVWNRWGYSSVWIVWRKGDKDYEIYMRKDMNKNDTRIKSNQPRNNNRNQ